MIAQNTEILLQLMELHKSLIDIASGSRRHAEEAGFCPEHAEAIGFEVFQSSQRMILLQAGQAGQP